MDAVVDNLRQPQHLDAYQEADEIVGGERTLGDTVRDAQIVTTPKRIRGDGKVRRLKCHQLVRNYHPIHRINFSC